MLRDILNYIDTNGYFADVVYSRMEGGTKHKALRKEGNINLIAETIDYLRKSNNTNEIFLNVYRANGSSMRLDRQYQVYPVVESVATKFSDLQQSVTNYNEPQESRSFTQALGNLPEKTTMNNWQEYALQTEREKVSKLEAQLERLQAENKTLDERVREYEKDMIRKEHELQNLSRAAESKSGLNGLIEKASENPALLNMLVGLAGKLMGDGGQPQLAGNVELQPQTKVDQYVQNIQSWLVKQPEPLQDMFYSLVYELTHAPDVPATTKQLINLIKHGTTFHHAHAAS